MVLDTRLVLVGIVAFLCTPLLRPCGNPGALDDISSWALQGPSRDAAVPLMGVFLFRGLNPAFLVDLSYLRGFKAQDRSFVLDMGGPGFMYLTDARESDFSGEFKTTSPVPSWTGGTLMRVFRMLRASLKFTFNEDYTRASISPALLSSYNPLVLVMNRLLKEEMVLQRGGAWKRINFAPPTNSTPTDAHYYLHPVVTKKGDGKAAVVADGLRMAKRKLAMGAGVFQQCR